MIKNENSDERMELTTVAQALKRHLVAYRDMRAEGGISSVRYGTSSSSCDENETRIFAVPAPVGHRRTLDEVRHGLGDCRRCHLHLTRKSLVFGEGNPSAPLVFVGEAPGEQEDIQGRPFVGKAGQLLTRIIEAMNFQRNQVYICNILKCRPPENRNPRPDEIEVCEPFLMEQLASIQPKVICALGTFAARTLLKTDAPISGLRGRFHTYQGIPLMPTFHPAYLLRNPGGKKQVWDDMQVVMDWLRRNP